MSTKRITSREVDAAEAQRRDVFIWDGQLAGFGVRVTPTGTKSYIYQYRLGGRGSACRRYTIGRHRSPWTARTARIKAVRLAKQVAKGKDPVMKRRDQRRKEVELRFDRYVELFTTGYLKTRWKDWKRVHAMLTYYAVPVIGSRKLSDVTRADISGIYRRLDNKPSVAKAMHATLRKMFRWAMSRDDIQFSPVDGVEAPLSLRARSRYLSDAELRAAWTTSSALSYPYGALLRMLMLTGQRRGEVAGMNWGELSRARAEWILPAEKTKNGRAHIIPLSNEAIAILDTMAGATEWPSLGLVFQSSCATKLSGFSKIKKAWDSEITKQLDNDGKNEGMAPWRLHDIRRTVATGMQRLSIRTEVIEAVLNHVSGLRSGIVGVYQCYDYGREKRQAMEAWESFIKRSAM